MVKLSVIIPVYNAAKYLRECLDSALRQGFEENEYEVICVDDCSVDNSYDIVLDYAIQYKQIKCVRNHENSGVSVSRNNGLKIAQGEYITFLDSDDMIADGAYLQVFNELVRSGNAVATWYYGCHMGSSFQPTISNVEFECCPAFALLNKVNMVWGLMIKKQIIDKYSLWFAPGVSYAEDALFCYLLLLSQGENAILRTEAHLYFYRIVDGSLSKEDQNTPKWFTKLSDNMKKLTIYLTNYLATNRKQFSEEQILLIQKRISEYSARAVYNAVKAKRTDIEDMIIELKGCDAYPYKVHDVIKSARIRGGISSYLKSIAINLILVILNFRLCVIAIGKFGNKLTHLSKKCE